MKACDIIPARFASSRFPGKPLAKLNGKEMILWVAENCSRAVNPSNVYIATDDKRISDTVIKKGFKVIITSPDLITGTDRVAEASKNLDYEIFINVQGDEPLIEVEAINQLGKFMMDNQFQYGTLAKNFGDDDILKDKNKVKVIVEGNKGLDFYRTNPNSRHDNCKILHHVGVYAFTAAFLKLFAKTPISVNEAKLKLEQLRAIDNDLPINVLELELKNSWGIDTEEDLKKLREYLKSN